MNPSLTADLVALREVIVNTSAARDAWRPPNSGGSSLAHAYNLLARFRSIAVQLAELGAWNELGGADARRASTLRALVDCDDLLDGALLVNFGRPGPLPLGEASEAPCVRLLLWRINDAVIGRFNSLPLDSHIEGLPEL